MRGRWGPRQCSVASEKVATEAVPQLDPGDPKRVLDVWYQVTFEGDIDSNEQLADTVAFALSMDKVVPA